MKIIVTGSNGFIGSSLIKSFQNKPWSIFGIDLQKESNCLQNGFYTQCNLSSDSLFDEVGGIFQEADLVIHCAGKSSVQQSVLDPLSDYQAGPIATYKILDCLRKNGKPHSSFIFLSSAAVYGNPSKKPTDESCATNPISPYGFHKLQCENIIEMYSQFYGIQGICLRVFSAYGANLKRQVVYDLARKIYFAKQKDVIEIYGTGNESRDFVHISDICKTIDKLISRDKKTSSFEIFNLASGKEMTIKNLLETFRKFFNKDVSFSFSNEKALGMPDNWCADISKLKKIGMDPVQSIENFLHEYSF